MKDYRRLEYLVSEINKEINGILGIRIEKNITEIQLVYNEENINFLKQEKEGKLENEYYAFSDYLYVIKTINKIKYYILISKKNNIPEELITNKQKYLLWRGEKNEL